MNKTKDKMFLILLVLTDKQKQNSIFFSFKHFLFPSHAFTILFNLNCFPSLCTGIRTYLQEGLMIDRIIFFASGVHVHFQFKHVIRIEIYIREEMVMKDKHHHACTCTYDAFLFYYTSTFQGFLSLQNFPCNKMFKAYNRKFQDGIVLVLYLINIL